VHRDGSFRRAPRRPRVSSSPRAARDDDAGDDGASRRASDLENLNFRSRDGKKKRARARSGAGAA